MKRIIQSIKSALDAVSRRYDSVTRQRTLPVQIQGRFAFCKRFSTSAGIVEIQNRTLVDRRLVRLLKSFGNVQVEKVVVVPGKLVNIVPRQD